MLTFFPDEIISILDITPNQISTISFQLLGALYLGFAMVNWISKRSLIGGIYNKPIAAGNFMHFLVGALALIKFMFKTQNHLEILILLTVSYCVFAAAYTFVFWTNPSKLE